MSLPRRQYLAEVPRTGLRLFSAPYGLDAIRGDEIASNSSLNNGTLFANFADVDSLAALLEVNVTGINASLVTSASTVNFTFFNPSTGESIRGGYYLGGQSYLIHVTFLRLKMSYR
jgi:beta-fructofuranosidase